jgi:hypothetical protein
MSHRLVALLAFVAVFLGIQVFGARRDRPARVPFEMTPPADFQSFDRSDAAAYAANFDEEEMKKYSPEGGAKVFLHFRAEGEPPGPPIVVETEINPYELRVQDSDRDALFTKPGMTREGVDLTLRESHVAKLGDNEVIVARYDATVGEVPVVMSMYAVPTDRGMALVSAFCPKADESKYVPIYDQMIAGAKGVAYRPARLAWYLSALFSAFVAAIAYGILWRVSHAKRAPKSSAQKESKAGPEGS